MQQNTVWLLKWRLTGEYYKGRLNHYAFWGEKRSGAHRFDSLAEARAVRSEFGVGGKALVVVVRLTRRAK